MGAHLVNGTFQSDKYPTCPPGKVPLSVKDETAQDLLWEYAQRRRAVDPEFSDDLEAALLAAGYNGGKRPDEAGDPKTGEKMGLWALRGIEGGKYLVVRRDGTIPSWPHFVLGGKDPWSPAALLAYADAAEKDGGHPDFVADVRRLAVHFNTYRATHGNGDPEAVPHRKDDPATVAKMVAHSRGA